MQENLQLSKQEYRDLANKMEEMEKDRSYDCTFPPSETLQEHKESFPRSFLVQFIGARGVGKSSLINYYISRYGFFKKRIVECYRNGYYF